MFRRVWLVGLLVAIGPMQGCSDSTPAATPCTVKDVTMQLGDSVPDGGQYLMDVFISNVRSTPCFIAQRPAMQLLNDSATATRASIDVPPAGADAATASTTPVAGSTIAIPGKGSVVASLTYITGPDPACDSNGPWVPTRFSVTLDNGLVLGVDWTGKSVDDCQEGATHPGTFVGPFVATQ